jgi:hypothetical protein
MSANAANSSVRTVLASATAVLVVSGPGSVHEIVLSSGTSFVVLRDSGTANSSSTALMPNVAMTTVPQVFKFDPPIPFRNGLSMNLSAGNTNEGVSVLYQTGRF